MVGVPTRTMRRKYYPKIIKNSHFMTLIYLLVYTEYRNASLDIIFNGYQGYEADELNGK
jgi:hypothetical protein